MTVVIFKKPEFTAVSVGIKENGVFNGWTNPFEPDAVAYYTASPTETATSDFKSLGGFVSGELFGETQFVLGFEQSEFSYENLFDKQSEVGNVGGSSGNSDGGSRDYSAIYFETATPFSGGRGERFSLLEGKMIILILEQTLHILRKRFIS